MWIFRQIAHKNWIPRLNFKKCRRKADANTFTLVISFNCEKLPAASPLKFQHGTTDARDYAADGHWESVFLFFAWSSLAEFFILASRRCLFSPLISFDRAIPPTWSHKQMNEQIPTREVDLTLIQQSNNKINFYLLIWHVDLPYLTLHYITAHIFHLRTKGTRWKINVHLEYLGGSPYFYITNHFVLTDIQITI